MSVGIKRSPVRPLSISNLSMAFPGELLIDPTTGNITYLDDSSNQIVHKKPGTLTIKYGDTTLASKADLTTDISVTIPAAGSASETTAGMMSPEDKKKLDGIEEGANKYIHPSYTAQSSGLYKITVDATGHVSKVVAVAKADITALGIPGQDTKYTHPSHTAYEEGLYKVTVDSLGHVTKTAAVTKTDITALGIPAQDTVYTHPTHTAHNSGLYKITVDGLGHVTGATKVAKADITALGIPGQDTVYTHPTYDEHASGLYKITVDGTGHVSAVTAVTKTDITGLGIPAQDTTYSDMVGASASAAGTHGLVPAPAKGDQAKYLSGAGTWVALPTSIASATTATKFATAQSVALTGDVTGSASSQAGWSISTTLANSGVTAGNYGPSANATPGMGGTFSVPYITVDAKGRVTAASTKTITMPSFSYTHPAYDEHTSGLYKITVDAMGHVSAVVAVAKADITALGIPGQDTTYSDMVGASASAAGAHGLVPAPAKGDQNKYLSGAGTWVALPTSIASATTATKFATAQTVELTGDVTGSASSKAGWSIAATLAASGVTAGNYGPSGNSAPGMGGTFSVPYLTVDAKGRVTAASTKTITMPSFSYSHPTHTAYDAGLYKITVDGLGHVTAATAVAKADITALGIPGQDTTYSDMVGATASAAGAHGLVPAPAKGDQNKFLTGAGTWVDVTTISGNAATATQFASAQSVALTGDVTGSASSKAGWSIAATLAASGVTAGNYGPSANATPGMGGTFSVPYLTVDAKGRVTAASTKTITMPSFSYSHPTHTAYDSGLYKITVDGLGHVTAATKVAKADITALGIPGQDTVYTHPTYTNRASGLYKITVDGTGHVSAATAVTKDDITGLGIPAQDTKYTHPTYTARDSGLYKITVDGTGHVSAVAAVAKADITALGIPGQDTTYSDMVGATASAAGTHGLVPAPAAGDQAKYLSGAGTWVSLPTSVASANTATTATKFASAQSVALTGDVTGSASSQAGWSISTTLANSGVSAGNYGPTGNASPGSGGTFSVPYFTVDAKGRVTAAATRTITMPTVPSIPNLGLSTSGSGNVVTGLSVSGHTITITKGSVATHAKYTATIGTGWSGSSAPYTIAVTVSGIQASDIPIIDFKPSGTYSTDKAAEEAWLNVYRAVTAANKITFYAHEKPTVNIPINIICDR